MAARRMRWFRIRLHRQERYAPRLLSVWVVAPFWLLVAASMCWGIYQELLLLAMPHPGPNGAQTRIDPLDVIKTTITVAGAVGAVLVGVYAYRKQRLVEGDARRADAEHLAQRYTSSAEQLGNEKAAVRLAGVYAMAQLADDWDDQRQVCIDVLCAYLRMPYETEASSNKYREGEREVRLTIIRLIRDHLRDPEASTTWCGRDLDFRNAVFDGADFDEANFTGGEISFNGAKFVDGEVSFDGAVFAGSEVSFVEAKFIGGTVSFVAAQFTGGKPIVVANFPGSVGQFTIFSIGWIYFDYAEFSGGNVYFSDAKFSGSYITFHGAKFTAGEISFDGADFIGGKISFSDAEFGGSQIIWDYSNPRQLGLLYRNRTTDKVLTERPLSLVGPEVVP